MKQSTNWLITLIILVFILVLTGCGNDSFVSRSPFGGGPTESDLFGDNNKDHQHRGKQSHQKPHKW